MADSSAVTLITVRTRTDREFPGVLFVTMQRLQIEPAGMKDEPVNVASATEAIDILQRWLSELENSA